MKKTKNSLPKKFSYENQSIAHLSEISSHTERRRKSTLQQCETFQREYTHILE